MRESEAAAIGKFLIAIVVFIWFFFGPPHLDNMLGDVFLHGGILFAVWIGWRVYTALRSTPSFGRASRGVGLQRLK